MQRNLGAHDQREPPCPSPRARIAYPHPNRANGRHGMAWGRPIGKGLREGLRVDIGLDRGDVRVHEYDLEPFLLQQAKVTIRAITNRPE